MVGKEVITKLKELYGDEIWLAFCPYKASMFDCMESVFVAAEEDGLVADIIPLDYQTLPDGEWHNESTFFRGKTPHVCTLEDLITGQYDVIIIHYPYDGRNNVTKLRQDCWVESLKQYGKVCYIPYHGNIAEEKWSRFYTMPGAAESDAIVLGSDFDVQMFKKENPYYAGEIIQVSDSPKTDAPLLHENDELPEKWKDLKQPITLIIGTLWTFTHDPVGRILKHQDIVRKEVEAGHSIIYRPHPLVYHAICVMRPEAKELYNDFLDQLREDGVVIDDGPNLHRTLAVAQKIYIDPSSVIKSIQNHREYEVIE